MVFDSHGNGNDGPKMALLKVKSPLLLYKESLGQGTGARPASTTPHPPPPPCHFSLRPLPYTCSLPL